MAACDKRPWYLLTVNGNVTDINQVKCMSLGCERKPLWHGENMWTAGAQSEAGFRAQTLEV